MNQKTKELKKEDWPKALHQIPQRPKELFVRGNFPKKEDFKFLCVVGSRKYSDYAKEALEKLIAGLRGKNVVIVSGLAIGVDTIAHREALKNDLKTVAVLGSGVSDSSIYPRSNFTLAKEIIEERGCLLSEFDEGIPAPWTFPQRNRIMAGIADVILIVEANEKSGTLITARLGTDYNKEVCVLPASILSTYSIGSNKLLQDGAYPILDSKDLLFLLGIKEDEDKEIENLKLSLNKKENKVLDCIYKGITDFDGILEEAKIEISELSGILMELEIKEVVMRNNGEYKIKNC